MSFFARKRDRAENWLEQNDPNYDRSEFRDIVHINAENFSDLRYEPTSLHIWPRGIMPEEPE